MSRKNQNDKANPLGIRLNLLKKIPGHNSSILKYLEANEDKKPWLSWGEYDLLVFEKIEAFDDYFKEEDGYLEYFERMYRSLYFIDERDSAPFINWMENSKDPFMMYSGLKINYYVVGINGTEITKYARNLVEEQIKSNNEEEISKNNFKFHILGSLGVNDLAVIFSSSSGYGSFIDTIYKLRQLRLSDLKDKASDEKIKQELEKLMKERGNCHIFNSSFSIPCFKKDEIESLIKSNNNMADPYDMRYIFQVSCYPGHEKACKFFASHNKNINISFHLGAQDVQIENEDLKGVACWLLDFLEAEKRWVDTDNAFPIISSCTSMAFVPEEDKFEDWKILVDESKLEEKPFPPRPSPPVPDMEFWKQIIENMENKKLIHANLSLHLRHFFTVYKQALNNNFIFHCLLDTVPFVRELYKVLRNAGDVQVKKITKTYSGRFRKDLETICNYLNMCVNTRLQGDLWYSGKNTSLEYEASFSKIIMALTYYGLEMQDRVCKSTEIFNPVLCIFANRSETFCHFLLDRVMVILLGIESLKDPDRGRIYMAHEISHYNNAFMDNPDFFNDLEDCFFDAVVNHFFLLLNKENYYSERSNKDEKMDKIKRCIQELMNNEDIYNMSCADRTNVLRERKTFTIFVNGLISMLQSFPPSVSETYKKYRYPEKLVELSLEKVSKAIKEFIVDFQAMALLGESKFIEFIKSKEESPSEENRLLMLARVAFLNDISGREDVLSEVDKKKAKTHIKNFNLIYGKLKERMKKWKEGSIYKSMSPLTNDKKENGDKLLFVLKGWEKFIERLGIEDKVFELRFERLKANKRLDDVIEQKQISISDLLDVRAKSDQ